MSERTEQEVSAGLRNAHVPERYALCRLNNFETRPEFPGVVPFLKEYIAKQVNPNRSRGDPERMGIFLTGSLGTGKTHLAVSLEAEFESVGLRTHFSPATGFLLECQQSRQFCLPKREDEDLERMKGLRGSKSYRPTSVLVLDDLGVESLSPFGAQMIDMLVEWFYGQNHHLIVTSNLALRELAKRYPRVADRLAEVCHVVRLSGESYRVLKARRRVAADAVEEQSL